MDPDELTGPPTKGGGEGSGRGRVLHPAPPRVADASPHRDPGGPARRSRPRLRMDRRAVIPVNLVLLGRPPATPRRSDGTGGPRHRPATARAPPAPLPHPPGPPHPSPPPPPPTP